MPLFSEIFAVGLLICLAVIGAIAVIAWLGRLFGWAAFAAIAHCLRRQ